MGKAYIVGIRECDGADWFQSTTEFPNDNQASRCLSDWKQKFVALYGEESLPMFYRNTRIMKVRKEAGGSK